MKTLPKEKIRMLLRPAAQLLLVVAFLVTVGFADSRRHDTVCTGLEVRVHSAAGHAFLERSDVIGMVQDKIGSPVGKTLSSINMAMLEKIINSNAYVARAEVFSTVDGKLNLDVVQRNPVLRIINRSKESFYIDEEGVFMPLSDAYTANVTVANGDLNASLTDRKIRVFEPEDADDTTKHLTTVEKIFVLNRYMSRSAFWSAQVEQVYVGADREFEIIPRMGDHAVRLGDVRDLNEKFEKLFHFYRQGLNRAGWNAYRTIDVRYKDQVVCTKK